MDLVAILAPLNTNFICNQNNSKYNNKLINCVVFIKIKKK